MNKNVPALKPYPATKNSGVPWLGEVPAHWEVRRQRNIVSIMTSNVDKHTVEGEIPIRLCNYVDVYKHDVITDRIPFMHATASRDEIYRFRLKIGDVVITKDSETWDDIGVPALVPYEAPDFVCGYHLAILRPREDIIYGAYLLRALQSQGVAVQHHVSANGVTRFGLSQDAIKSVWVPLPPIPEQRAIARFLDHIDRLTRRYVRAQRRLIELLTEQKQALIQQAVTRGLPSTSSGQATPDVPLKDSGVEWLGEIPEHWKVRKLKRIAQFNPSKSESLYFFEAGQSVVFLPMEKVSINGDIDCSEKRPIEELWNGYTYFRRYDVVIAKITPCFENGKGAFLQALETEIGFGTTEFIVLRASSQIDPQFLYQLTMMPIFRQLGAEAMTGAAGQQRVPVDFVKNFPVPVPPIDEQKQILNFVHEKLVSFNETITHTQRQIDLVRDYRARLIADVVTGKLDVRGVPLRELDKEGDLDELDDL